MKGNFLQGLFNILINIRLFGVLYFNNMLHSLGCGKGKKFRRGGESFVWKDYFSEDPTYLNYVIAKSAYYTSIVSLVFSIIAFCIVTFY